MTYILDACALIVLLNKARYPMSLADAFLCATAKCFSATIVTKDKEIKPVEESESLPILWIQ